MAKKQTTKVITKKYTARLEREHRQKRTLLIGSIVVVILVVGIVGYGILDQVVLKQRKPVAQVGEQLITIKEFQTQVRFTRWQLIQQFNNTLQIYQMFASDPELSKSFADNLQQIQYQLSEGNATSLGDTVINQMVDQRLIEQEARRLGITVRDEEIEETLQGAFGYFPGGTPTPTITPTLGITSTISTTQIALVTLTPTLPETIPGDLNLTVTPETESEESLNKTLPTSTPYTQEGYQNVLQEYTDQLAEANLSEDDLRDVIRSQLYREQVINAITADVQPIQEQVWARHILVNDENKAIEILNRLKQGEDWTELAAEFSNDTSNKNNGGDLGWFSRGKMVSEFENSSYELHIGEISEPIETQFGWHVIQVLGHEMRPLDQNEYQAVREQEFTKWLENIRESKTIEIFENWIDSIPLEPTIPPNQFPVPE